MSVTHTWANSWIDYYLLAGASTAYVDCDWIGLSTTTPASDGTNFTEPVGGGYARIPNPNYVPTGPNNYGNDTEAVFAVATADWPSVTYVGLFNAMSGGDLLMYGELSSPTIVYDTDIAKFIAFDLAVNWASGAAPTLGYQMFEDSLATHTPTSPPANIYFGLSSTAPAVDGSNVTEPVGDGYARVTYGTGMSYWNAPTIGTTTNAQQIIYPVATGSWGLMTHWVVYDASTGGNLLLYGPITVPETVGVDDQLAFDTTGLTLYFS